MEEGPWYIQKGMKCWMPKWLLRNVPLRLLSVIIFAGGAVSLPDSDSFLGGRTKMMRTKDVLGMICLKNLLMCLAVICSGLHAFCNLQCYLTGGPICDVANHVYGWTHNHCARWSPTSWMNTYILALLIQVMHPNHQKVAPCLPEQMKDALKRTVPLTNLDWSYSSGINH